jgi:hypothetical protein
MPTINHSRSHEISFFTDDYLGEVKFKGESSQDRSLPARPCTVLLIGAELGPLN